MRIVITCLFFMAAIVIPCRSQVIDLQEVSIKNRLPITQQSSILASTIPIDIDSVITIPDSFKRVEQKSVLIFNYDPYHYWFRFVVGNKKTSSKKMMLLMAPVGISDAILYKKVYGKWQPIAHSGLKYRFKERTYQFTHHVFPVEINSSSLDTLYLSIDATNAYKSFGFALISPKTLKIFENKLYFIFGIIEGLVILFFVLNVSLFFALRDKIHLWYALYISLLFLIVMKNDHLDQQFLGLDSELAFRLTPYMSIGAFAIAILIHVVQLFFKKEIATGTLLYKVATALKLNVIISAIAHYFIFLFATDYRLHAFVFSWAKLSTLLGILLIIAICIYSLRKGNKGALFIFCGTVVFLIGSAQRLYLPSTLSFLFPPTTFHAGIIVETFVITLGLIFRYWNEKNLQRQREDQIMTQTMQDISEEIHDNVGQILTLANLNLRSLPAANKKDELTLDETKTLISNAIGDLRNLSRSLMNEDVSEQSISKKIETELHSLEKTGFLQTKFYSDGTEVMLENKKLSIIIRIIRELLQNAIKHSKATTVEVSLLFEQKHLQINIMDNGIGFDPVEVKHKSNGLHNIRNRCIMLNAGYKIESSIGQGTCIDIRVPLNT